MKLIPSPLAFDVKGIVYFATYRCTLQPLHGLFDRYGIVQGAGDAGLLANGALSGQSRESSIQGDEFATPSGHLCVKPVVRPLQLGQHVADHRAALPCRGDDT